MNRIGLLRAITVPLIGLFTILLVLNFAPVANLPFGGKVDTACAQAAPNLTVLYTVAASSESAFSEVSNPRPGDTIGFAIEVHNTVVGADAENLLVRATLPTGPGTITSTVTVSSSTTGSNTASDSVTVNLPAGATLSYIPGSTRLTWDRDGDGTKEFNSSPLGDGIVASNGVNLGTMRGCNEFIAQLLFTAQVSQAAVTPTPTPTTGPTATPTPTPTQPPVGGQQQTQTQTTNVTQTNTQTQNVTVNQPAPPAGGPAVVLGAKAPVVQPKAGPEAALLLSLFGMLPAGMWLRRKRSI